MLLKLLLCIALFPGETRLTPSGEEALSDCPIRFELWMNGKQHSAFIDSGVSASVFDDAFRIYCHGLGEQVQVSTPDGPVEMDLYSACWVRSKLGEQRLSPVVVHNLYPMRRIFGDHYVAVLGPAFLRGEALCYSSVDRCYFTGNSNLRNYTHKFQLEESNGLYHTMSLVVEGQPIPRALLDTGANSPISMSQELFAKVLKIPGVKRLPDASTLTAKGISKKRAIRVPTIELFGSTLRDVPCIESDETSVGLDALRRFDYRIRFAESEIDVEPNDSLDSPFRINTTGIKFDVDRNGKLIVREVSDGSPAAAVGIEPGDVVESLNGQRTKAAWRGLAMARGAVRAYPLESIQIDVDRSGSRKRFVLADKKVATDCD